jgi:PAS domain S-box-containing protein
MSPPAPDELLNARARVGLWTVLIAVAALSIQDFQLPGGGSRGLHLVRLVELILIGIAAVVNRQRPRRRVDVLAAVAFISGIYFTSAISGYLRNDAQTLLVTDLAMAFGTAATLPWGPWSQLVTVGCAAFSAALGWMLVYGTLADVSVHMLTGFGIALLASVYIAYQLARYRTQRDEAEEALRASEERFRSLIEHGSDTITIVDAEGVIVYESPSVERILGYRPAELIGRPVLDYLHSDDVARIPWGALPSGGMISMECRCRRKDGTWCDVEAVGTNLLDHPTVRGIVINWRDIGERKQAEEERAVYMRELADARDEALASTRAKSAFLANTSHEIRTPMNVIIGMTDMVLETELEPAARHDLQRVRAAALALLEIINDILDLSKIEAGKMTTEIGPFHLGATLDGVTQLLGPSAAAKSLVLACRLDPRLPAHVCGDAGRLRQVLTNLVGNAIKFTERGEVILEARVLSETASHAEILFAVRDTGIGIPADRQTAVFESFTQVDAGTTRKYGGTGLGLTISRHFVELMGGALRIESAVGEGSTFSFTLDLARERPAAMITPQPIAGAAPSAA